MEIDCEYGNVPLDVAQRMAKSIVLAPAPQVSLSYPAGATESWISALAYQLLKATGVASALETGAYLGHTSVWLAQAIRDMGGGDLWLCEIERDRAYTVEARLRDLNLSPLVHWEVVADDAMRVIDRLPDRTLGLAFVDDDHTMEHVKKEVEALFPKMAQGGIMLFHDVFGVCDLQQVVKYYGGYCLDFARCGPAGGLGLLQTR
jgi:hypothetical protein